MLNTPFKKILLLSTLIILLPILLFSNENTLKWRQISGEWTIINQGEDNYLFEKKGKTHNWGYSDLINYNSVVTFSKLEKYSRIDASVNAINPMSNSTEILLFFATKDYKNFYAFKLLCNKKNITKLSFIQSKTKDPSKKAGVKWNFIITELAKKDYTIPLEKIENFSIRFQKNRAQLYINKKYVFSVKAEEDLTEGKIGFSNRNIHLKIYDVKVFNRWKVVFEDDFKENTLKKIKFKSSVKTIKKKK